MSKLLRTPTGAANMRGAVDFSDASAFNLAEKGHGIFVVLNTPKMMKAIKANSADSGLKYAYVEQGTTTNTITASDTIVGKNYLGLPTILTPNSNLVTAIDEFPKILESEFKGLDGLDDITSDTMEISDGISTLNVLGSVNYSTNQEITLRFTEKAGRTLTTYSSAYLRAIRDTRTKAKTYLGCANIFAPTNYTDGERIIKPDFANEVFTFLYIIPDNTWEVCEKVYLLANAQITKAAYSSLDNFDKGDIGLVEIDIPFNTFVITDNDTVNEMGNEFLKKYVSRAKYTEGAWNINSQTLDYKAVTENKELPNPTSRTQVSYT